MGISLALWASSLAFFDLDRMSGYGLLNAAPFGWFMAAVIAFVAYLVVATSGRASTFALSALHIVVVLILYGTTSAWYPQPRYTWMYKHVGVVEYLLEHNSVDRTIDVYHNWPGFFAGVAAVSRLTGIEPLSLSRWAEVVFGLALGAALYWAVGALTTDRRVVWTTVALFTLTNWVGQGYFAPQALATLLSLLFFGAALRILGRNQLQPRAVVGWILNSLRLRPSPLTVSSTPSIDTFVALASFAGLVTTHQLTPPAVLLQLSVLAVLVRFRPYWLLVVPVLMEAGWLGIVARTYITGHLKLLSFNLSENIDVPGEDLVASLPGLGVAQWSGPAMILLVLLLAAAGTVSWIRRGWVSLPAVALAAGPISIVALNSYGSEALFRIFLYALPWACFLAAQFLVGRDRHELEWRGAAGDRPPPARGALDFTFLRPFFAALVIVPITLTANFFLERINFVSDEDVAVATWFEDNTESDAYAMLVAPNYPTRITGGYPGHIIEDGAFAPAVTSWMDQRGRAEYAEEAAIELFDRFDWRPGYIVFSPSQRRYGQTWGLLPGVEYDRFQQRVEESPDFDVVYLDGRGMVAKYVGIHAP